MKYMTLLIAMMSLLMAGCNTMHGMGEDIEEGGEAVQRASDAD
jgi:entericidin B